MSDPIDDLAVRWQASQDVDSTIQLCDALSAVRTTLVQQVADFAQVKFASNVPVLVAVARMYMRANKHAEAQSVLVAAGKIAPRDGLVYRVLGEVLLRRGDADRAEKVFERAQQFGQNDEETKTWLERSRVFKPMQGKAGSRAVAAEVARTAPVAPAQRSPNDFDEDETAVRSPSAVPVGNNGGAAAAKDRKYPMNAPTIEPFSPPPKPARVAPPPMPAAPPPQRAAPPASPAPIAPPPQVARANTAPLAPMRDVPIARAEDPGRSPFRAASQPGVPDARDVLDALQLAGIFESAPTTPMKWDRAQRSRRRGTLPLVAITLLFVGGGIGGFRYVKMKRDAAHIQAEGMLTQIEADMRKSQTALLPPMEQQFSQVFDLDSRDERVALDWLRERALSGLLRGGGDVAFEDAMNAREAS